MQHAGARIVGVDDGSVLRIAKYSGQVTLKHQSIMFRRSPQSFLHPLPGGNVEYGRDDADHLSAFRLEGDITAQPILRTGRRSTHSMNLDIELRLAVFEDFSPDLNQFDRNARGQVDDLSARRLYR